MRTVTLVLVVMTALALVACGGGSEESGDTNTAADVVQNDQPAPEATPPAPPPEPPAPPPPPPSLAQRLGGREAIAAVVHGFAEKVLADRRIKRFFRRVNRESFETAMTDHLCHLGGGECQYNGRSMEEAHHGMHLTDAHFDALIEDLTAALDEAHIADAEKNELLGLVGPMRAQVVGQ
ncbi:MAG: group 1 truncated hemoglobin [Deltaproteobacteria bacterium]|nr:group 1 truncated hemoglobin [Deltaproteobacteria bacterium]